MVQILHRIRMQVGLFLLKQQLSKIQRATKCESLTGIKSSSTAALMCWCNQSYQRRTVWVICADPAPPSPCGCASEGHRSQLAAVIDSRWLIRQYAPGLFCPSSLPKFRLCQIQSALLNCPTRVVANKPKKLHVAEYMRNILRRLPVTESVLH